MPFFRRKRQDQFVGLEEEECNLRDMFGDVPSPQDEHEVAPMAAGSTSSSDFDDTSSSSAHDAVEGGIETAVAEPELNEEAQEVMNDNLELMRDVVMKIREDEEFARNIYANCPRLQALLKDHPDLRPLFEDPKFVVLNFEKVFRDAGGTLPGDEDANKPGKIKQTILKVKEVLGKITSHPLFKVFKVLMLIKKIVFFFSPSKFTGLFKECFWPSLDDVELDADGLDPEDPDYEAERTKLSLHNAADALEDPEVQEQMQEAMDDPDKLEDMIENNKELRELRDSNPVCAEMMNDPETLKVLSDPENLRALSEAPDLISEDFANPDAFLEALENAEMEGGDVDADFDADVDADAEAEMEAEMDDDAEYSDEYSDEDDGDDDEDDEEGLEDAVLEEVEFEAEEDDNRDRSKSKSKSRARQRSAPGKSRDGDKDGEEGGGAGGKLSFLSTVMEAGIGVMTGDLEAVTDMFAGGEDVEFDGGELEGVEDFEGGDEGMLEGIEEVEGEEEDDLLGEAEGIEETEAEDNELLAEAEENLEDVEETEKEEDVAGSEQDGDESTPDSEDQGVYDKMEEIDEGAAGQGMDLVDELDAEDADVQKEKEKEKEEREAREREAARQSGGFYGEFEADDDDDDDDDEDEGFASAFKSDPDDDWIRY